MILRNLKPVKLVESIEKQLDFGTETTEKITDIEMAIFEKSATDFNQNNLDGIRYDCLGLTKYSAIYKNMYILSDKEKYKVNFIQNSKRYKTVFLERVV